jgi:lipoprotein-anchoring transpeptidase ErfK/SrfK
MILAASALLLAGCASDPRSDRDTQYFGAGGKVVPGRANFDTTSYWDGDGAPGAAAITIRLSEQRAYFYKGGQLVGISAISTGREGYGTPTGRFKITQKNKDHRSNLYGDFVDADGDFVKRDVDIKKDKAPPGSHFLGAPMPYFMRIHGGTGMHAGFLPGFPASHGCIRMPDFMAESFFAHAPLGTPVTVAH